VTILDEMIPAIELIFKGIIIGLIVSVPMGPAGIVLVNRTIKRGLLSGFFSGMGVVVADTILAIVAGLGFTFIISFFEDEKVIISLISGLVIIGAGIKIIVSNPIKEFRKKERGKKTLLRDFISILILSLSNPLTIFVFVAFFSGINVNQTVKPQLVPFLLVPGIFLGTLGWWAFLSWFVNRFKRKIRLRGIVRVNQIAGILIMALGAVLLISLFTTSMG
jgi:threonine/homoserine/homoserine lactone efflux protein